MSDPACPQCPYCGNGSVLTDSAEVYGTSYGMIWICRPCKAWVGVHKNSKDFKRLGRLADEQLRYWKKRAHAHLDPLWRAKMQRDNVSKSKARGMAYKWLAKEMGIQPADCHIGMFDIEQCKQLITICEPFYRG